MISLTHILDYFIAESLRKTVNEDLQLRARITAGITLMYFSSMASLAFLLAVIGYLEILVWWPATISCALAASCYLGQMIYFKKTGNLFVSSILTMSILFLFTTRFIYITGGWNSQVILFLFIVPMCAFLITGHKQGMVWSILSIGVYALLGWLEYAGIATPQIAVMEYEKILRFFIWVFSWLMIVGGVMLYSGIVNSLNASINSEKEKARLKAMFDEESGAYTRKEFSKLLAKKTQAPKPGVKTFALVFIELVYQKSDSAKGHCYDVLKKLFSQIKQQLGDQVVVSRYGDLSMTALVSSIEEMDAVHKMLDGLDEKLRSDASEYGAMLCLGAVVIPRTFTDIHAMTDDARKALHHAKTQQEKYVVHLRGENKNYERDYMANVVVGSFEQILQRA